MKLLTVLLCAPGLTMATLRAADSSLLPTLRAADDERIAAMAAADARRLDDILSDALRYAHSTGAVDTKASFIETLTTGKSKYLQVEYETRDFTPLGSDVALMTGRATFHIVARGQPLTLHLSFLAVWRNEHGRWRFVAWQSCPLPAAPPAS